MMQDARCRIEMARIPITWHLGPGTRHRSRSDAEGRIPSTEDRARLPENAHIGYASCILHPFLNKAVEPTPGIRPPHRHPVPSSPLHSSLRHSVTPSLLSWVTAPISLDILEQTLTNLDSTKVHKMATPHHGCGGRPRREGGPIALRYHTSTCRVVSRVSVPATPCTRRLWEPSSTRPRIRIVSRLLPDPSARSVTGLGAKSHVIPAGRSRQARTTLA